MRAKRRSWECPCKRDWAEDPDSMRDKGYPEGFCGTCEACGEPGHRQDYPGDLEFHYGTWCDAHRKLIRETCEDISQGIMVGAYFRMQLAPADAVTKDEVYLEFFGELLQRSCYCLGNKPASWIVEERYDYPGPDPRVWARPLSTWKNDHDPIGQGDLEPISRDEFEAVWKEWYFNRKREKG